MKLGKVFLVLEEARNYRDLLQATEGESLSLDAQQLADVLDSLLDLVSMIEVGS